MIRSILSSMLVMIFAVPVALADEMDPSKTNCSDMMMKQAEGMIKNGQTLQKGAKISRASAKTMRKSSPAEAKVFARMAAGMMMSGKNMEQTGKWMKKIAEKMKGSKGDHTMADHMAHAAKMPEKMRTWMATEGKAFATGMKEWGNEMIKHAEMAMGMYEKMASGGGGGEAKKEEPKPEEKK